MTEKRYFALLMEDGYIYPTFFDRENNDKEIDVDTVVDLLNENEKLKCQIAEDFNQSNCITVQKSIINDLKKQNEELKYENRLFSEELEQCKAVIEKRWSEYLRKKELSE